MTDLLATNLDADVSLRAHRLQLQVDALDELGRAIRSGEPVENVIPRMAAKAASLVGGRDALISLFDEDGALRLTLPTLSEDAEAIVFEETSHAYDVARSGEAVIVNDLSEAPLSDVDRAICRDHNIHRFMAVPLQGGDRLIGLLHITQRVDGEPFVAADVDRVATFANQAAIAIENARLYAETRAIATRLRALLDAAAETASSLEIDEILQRVCERACDLCDADTSTIALLDDTGKRLLTATLAGYDPAAELRMRSVGPIPLERDVLSREAFGRGAAVHAYDFANDPRTIARSLPPQDVSRSVTAVPLILRGTRIGILFVGWRRHRHRLTSRERELLETLARQASVATENARLFSAISRRTDQFKALVDLSVRAASETDAQAVIRATTEAAAKLLVADRASLRMYDEQRGLLLPRWAVGYAASVHHDHLVRRPGEGTPGRAFVERRAIVENRYNDPDLADGRPEHIGLHSSLSVPLLARGRAIGVLSVGSMHARRFDDEDCELLQLFANQAALAIENARLLERETDQARRLEVLYDNAKMLTSSLDVSDVLESMTAAAARLTQATFCACYLVEEESGDIVYAAGRGASAKLWHGLRLNAGEGLVGLAISHDQPLLIQDIRYDTRTMRADLDEAEGLCAVIYAPLRARGKVIGALGAGRPEPNSFTDEHVRLLSAFADHAASAIANARLYDRTESQVRYLNGLQAVVESISSELDLNTLLDKVVVQAARLLGADGGTVSLLNPQTGVARLKSVYGLDPELIDYELPAGTGLVGQVLQRREPVIVQRYADLAQPLTHPGLADVRAGIAAPIWRHEALIGVFAVFSRDPERRFTRSDVEALTTFAKHAAIAIENARLYEQSQQLAVTEERNRLAREIHDTLAQGLTAIILQLDLADMAVDQPDVLREHLQRALGLARENLQEARRSMLDLRSEALEGRSLPQALEKLVTEVGRELGIESEFRGTPINERFPARVESGLYRIAQEALTNVRKHAAASRVRVELQPRGDHLWLTISDDGRGFDPAQLLRAKADRGGFGLLGMTERAALIGAEIDIDSRSGDGTRVEVHVPMTGVGLRLRR